MLPEEHANGVLAAGSVGRFQDRSSDARMAYDGREGCEASHGGAVSKPKGGSTSEAALSI